MSKNIIGYSNVQSSDKSLFRWSLLYYHTLTLLFFTVYAPLWRVVVLFIYILIPNLSLSSGGAFTNLNQLQIYCSHYERWVSLRSSYTHSRGKKTHFTPGTVPLYPCSCVPWSISIRFMLYINLLEWSYLSQATAGNISKLHWPLCIPFDTTVSGEGAFNTMGQSFVSSACLWLIIRDVDIFKRTSHLCNICSPQAAAPALQYAPVLPWQFTQGLHQLDIF